jgi:hypothetical protein
MAPSRFVAIEECYPRATRFATHVSQSQIDVTVAIEMKTPPQPRTDDLCFGVGRAGSNNLL